MCNLANEIEYTPEAIVRAATKYPEVAPAVFWPDDKFSDVCNSTKNPAQRQELEENRQHSLAIFAAHQLVPLAMGAERLVIGDPTANEVLKYAYKSTNPEKDLIPEKWDYAQCCRHLGEIVIPTIFEVVGSDTASLLRSRQPWINCTNVETKISNLIKISKGPDSTDYLQAELLRIQQSAQNLDENIEEINDSLDGLFIDGCSLMYDEDKEEIVLVDTSLVSRDRILGITNTQLPRPERTWRSLDLVAV